MAHPEQCAFCQAALSFFLFLILFECRAFHYFSPTGSHRGRPGGLQERLDKENIEIMSILEAHLAIGAGDLVQLLPLVGLGGEVELPQRDLDLVDG